MTEKEHREMMRKEIYLIKGLIIEVAENSITSMKIIISK